MDYRPDPIDTSGVELSPRLRELVERLAANNHDHWAQQRMAEGWRFGPERNDTTRTHPDLVPYAELPDSEKEYDRRTVVETLKAILALGYRVDRD
jgi:hypothetical protein